MKTRSSDGVSRRTQSGKERRGTIGRFLLTVLVSAAASFAAATYAFNPQLISQLTGQVSLDTFLAHFERQPQGSGALHSGSTDGVVQTRFSDCPQFFPDGDRPSVPAAQALRELCFSSFAILHSGRTKTPVFVVQRLNRKMLLQAQNVDRHDNFYEEARLPVRDRATLADYRGSGYSRGHMAPAGDMHDPVAMAQSFSLANIVPQDQRHNGGAWSRIEQDTRKYVMRAHGDVFIYTGPVYSVSPQHIGRGRVAVPDYLYKLVYDPRSGRSWVHWHANSAQTKAGRPISYEEFVRRTGLQLLPPGYQGQ